MANINLFSDNAKDRRPVSSSPLSNTLYTQGGSKVDMDYKSPTTWDRVNRKRVKRLPEVQLMCCEPWDSGRGRHIPAGNKDWAQGLLVPVTSWHFRTQGHSEAVSCALMTFRTAEAIKTTGKLDHIYLLCCLSRNLLARGQAGSACSHREAVPMPRAQGWRLAHPICPVSPREHKLMELCFSFYRDCLEDWTGRGGTRELTQLRKEEPETENKGGLGQH